MSSDASSDPLAPGTPSWWIRIHLAPLCLVLVAGVQGYRVATCGQTPWKGGGFGMFSTIDGKDARLLKAWIVTDAGRIPVGVPKRLEKRADEVRAAPSAAGLADLAERLAELSWLDHDREWRDTYARYESLPPGEVAAGSLLHGQRVTAHAAHPLESAAPSFGRRADVEAGGKRRPGDEQGLAVRRIELEVWRLRFDGATCRVTTEPLLTTAAEVQP